MPVRAPRENPSAIGHRSTLTSWVSVSVTGRMKFLRKLFPIALGAILLSAIILGYSLNILADNKRDLVYQEIQQVLGKDVAFDDFDVTLWTGLGFSAKEFRVADRPIFAATPLLRAKELRMGVSLLQLLLGKIVINKLTFVAPEFQIITNEEGLMNVSSLENRRKQLAELPRPRSSSTRKENNSVSFLITKFQIKDGRIDFIDRSVREPAQMRIKNIEMDVKGITPNGRAKMTLTAALTEGLGQDVRIEGYVGPYVRGAGWKEQPVDLTVEFDSLFVPLLTRAVPFFRDKIPPELDIAGPLSLRLQLSGILTRPQIVDFILRAPMMGSSDYNAILNGSVDFPNNGAWSEAQLKGKLRLNSVNVTRLRSTAMFQRVLPEALTIEGVVSVESLFEGTWNTLRLGTIVRAGESDIRYRDWLRKPSGVTGQWSSKLSRQRNRWVLHESLLTLGSARFNLSGIYEQGPQPRLQVRARSERSELADVIALFPALLAYSAKGNLHADIDASKELATVNPQWYIRGKLGIAEAEISNETSGREIDRFNANLIFLGKQARVESAVFRVGSSHFEMKGVFADLARPALKCEIRSADLNLSDLAGFPVAKSDRLKNVALAGDIELIDGMPVLRGTLSSPEGALQDLRYDDLRAEMAWSPAGMSFKELSFRALDGILRNRDVWISGAEQSQRLALYSQIEAVDLQALFTRKFPLLKDRIDGRLHFQGQFTAEAHDGKLALASLKGSGDTQIRHGTLKNFNLIALLLSRAGSSTASKVAIELSPSLTELAKPKDTFFESLEAQLRVEKELIRAENLLLSTPDYNIRAAGWVMIDQTTRWNGMLVLSSRISQELLRENKSLRYLLDRQGQITLPFRAEGNLKSLKVRPDTRTIAQIVRRGSLPKAIEPPPVDKRQEKQEQKESLPAELEQFLSR
ncbi:MAG: AsmA-like C-terminal region-containing protein [Candidatus Binatia bacterium]